MPYPDTRARRSVLMPRPRTRPGWRIEPPVSVPVAAGARRGHGAGAAAGRAAGNAGVSQGCAPASTTSWAHGGNSGVLVAGAHGELVAVYFAQGHHALRRHLGDHGGVEGSER